MKNARVLALFLALAMLLGCGAFASGESSGGSGGGRYLTVNANGLTVGSTSGTVEGPVPAGADAISGIRFHAGSASDTFLSVSASEHTDPAAGFTAVLGGAEDLYPAPNWAEVYTNDGLNPNAEGFELDYAWISQIDRDPASPAYGRYTAVTPEGRALLDRLLPADAAYNVYIEGDSLDDEAGGRRGPTQVSVSGGAALLVENAYIYSEGLEGLAISNSGAAGVGSTMVVRDSLLASRGYVPAFAGQDENLPNDPLLVTGADRTNLSGGESVTYYYDSVVTVDGWASLSTDGASGDGVDLVAVDTFASALLGGYGTYADGNCRDFLYGSVLEGAEIGVIIAGTGEVSLYDGDDGLPGGAGYGVGLYGDIDPYAFGDVDASQVGPSVIAGGRNALMMHVAGTYTADTNGVFRAKDSVLRTDPALLSDEETEYSINASWYGRELSPNIQKYLELVEGDAILLKSVNALIELDNTDVFSYNGVLIHAVLNNDTSTPATPAGTNPVGTIIDLKNCDLAGDIVDDDYERVMHITLDNTALTGAITSGTCEDWNAYWLENGYAEDFTIGYASNTFGSEEPLDAFAHDIVMSEDGASFELTAYGDDQGTELTLKNGSVWDPTAESTLTALTVEPGCAVLGAVTVDGAVVDVSAGGAWTGSITVAPASGGASGASGEAAPALTDCPIEHETEFGGVYIHMTIDDFNALGYAYGDSVDVAFSNGYTLTDLPYYNGYYTATGDPLLVAYPGYPYIRAGINNGPSLWEAAGLDEGMTASVTLHEAGKYADIQDARDIHYWDERERYDSDEIFANFRNVAVGDMAEGVLYRAASPADNQHSRAPYVDALIAGAGVRCIVDLADTDEKLQGYIEAEDFASPYFLSLYESGNVLPLALNTNYGSETNRASIAAGLAAMAAHEGPYLVHCTEGKDRTGFICILLESLAGADYDELLDDYMITYANYYGITPETDPAKYDTIVENVFLDLLSTMIGDDGVDPAEADLAACARGFLAACGMTDGEIDALHARLTG